MYSREIDGKEFTFGVSGKLIMNALVMYDRQTDSLWGQIIGEAIQGPMKGTTLEFIPAIHTTWEDWKRLHPDTLALRKGYFGAVLFLDVHQAFVGQSTPFQVTDGSIQDQGRFGQVFSRCGRFLLLGSGLARTAGRGNKDQGSTQQN